MRGADRVKLLDRRLSCPGQVERIGASVRGDLMTHDQLSPLEFVDQLDKIRLLDPKRLRDRRLRGAGITIDRRQHPILGRTNIMLGERADEIVEDGKLRAPKLITDDIDEWGQIYWAGGFARNPLVHLVQHYGFLQTLNSFLQPDLALAPIYPSATPVLQLFKEKPRAIAFL